MQGLLSPMYIARFKLFHRYKKFLNFLYYWFFLIINPYEAKKKIPSFVGFFRDLDKYSKSEGAEPLRPLDIYPCLYNKTANTPFSRHYFYQHNWVFKKILESRVRHHIDVGSDIYCASFLSVIIKVTFVDIRPLKAYLYNLHSLQGSILSMPYKTNSVISLSCLHVAEHVGLGRYGDSIDPLGTRKAARELSRILAPGGNLFFSVPIGKPRLFFNARRIHSTKQILDYFSDLKLVELSGLDDKGRFIKNIDKAILDSCIYGCGLFWFSKR